jgi:flagellar basal-body rod modification protein FlgD
MSTTSNAATMLPSLINNTSSSTAQAANSSASQQLAGNFDTFLQLLTTQLQNQNPLDPLDTNQFTEQLVEFASVEQQINENTNLQTLISMQQTNEATSALQLVGSTVTVGGNAAALDNADNSAATWSLTTTTPATANVTVTSAAGTTAYSGTMSLNAGTQTFTWNGQGNHRNRRQRTGGFGIVSGPRRGQRRQSHLDPADADGERSECSDQPGHFDHALSHFDHALGDFDRALSVRRRAGRHF